MSQFGSAKARQVLAVVLRTGWVQKRQSGSHHTLARLGWDDYTFACHDGDEIGPTMLNRITKKTWLRPTDF